MKILSVSTPGGPRLAIKVNDRVLIASSASEFFNRRNITIPQTVQQALTENDGIVKMERQIAPLLTETEIHGFTLALEEVSIASLFLPRNIICVGLNYKDHAEESETPLPQQPVLFAKWNSSVSGFNQPIVIPPDTKEVDYEAELAVVIGRECRNVSIDDALNFVAGYTCMNDVSARDFQRLDGQWVRAKSQDTFAPFGPYLVTPDEIPDPQSLPIRCMVNDRVLQDSNTSRMIFGVRELIAFISRGITLHPGDLISTGTPHGVGFAQKPPVFLQPGDVVVVEIDGIGRLSNPVKES